MKYMVFDESNGAITGFFSDEVHGEAGSDGSKIPVGAIKINDEEWLDCVGNPRKWMVDVQAKALTFAPPPAPPTAEFLLVSVRARRDALLAASDWTQLPDSPLAADKKSAWATYRQQLRGLPATCDPANTVWPTPPV